MNIEELKSNIIQIVNKFWDSKKRPLLLSLLGSINDAEIARNVKMLDFTLRDFLLEEMADTVRVGTHSKNKVLVGAYPYKIGSFEQEKLDNLLEENSSVSSSVPRFHKTYWAAFKVGLAKTERRYISISDQPSFIDIGMKEVPPTKAIEVDRKFLVDPEVSSDQEVYHQVVAWAEVHGVELDRLTLGFYSKRNLQSESLMQSILEALGPQDLERILMPLDVVQKLLNTK